MHLSRDQTRKEIAERIQQNDPHWFVIWGVYSREYVAFPVFDAPPGTVRAGSMLGIWRAGAADRTISRGATATEGRQLMPGHDDPREKYLDRLRLELGSRGVRSELLTSGFRPRLQIVTPFLHGGFADAEFEDNILAAPSADGQWCYWWPWIEKIAPVDDVLTAADHVAKSMLSMIPSDPGDDDAQDAGAGDRECAQAAAARG